MVMEQFPMFRLATLLARQLSSPIASRIKVYATRHPVFRRALVVRAGRAYRAAELRFKLWMLRLGRPPRSPPLSEHDATQVGADIIGEMIIFSLGAAIVVFEVNRQAVNKELKELDERSHWVAILVGLEELQREVALQQQDLDRLRDALREFAPHAFPQRPSPPSMPPPAPAVPSPPSPQPTAPTAPLDPPTQTKLPDSVPTTPPKSLNSASQPEIPSFPAGAPPPAKKPRPPHC